MSRRRPSLMDIIEEDQGSSEPKASPPSPTPAPSAEPAPPKPANKSDYIRLSITVPPDMFERLQAISLQRRRAKQPYTFCHLARQAMLEWLDQQEEASE